MFYCCCKSLGGDLLAMEAVDFFFSFRNRIPYYPLAEPLPPSLFVRVISKRGVLLNSRGRPPSGKASPTQPKEAASQPVAAKAEKQVPSAAISLVLKENRLGMDKLCNLRLHYEIM